MQSQPGLEFELLIESQKTGVHMKVFIRQNEYVDGITQQRLARCRQHLLVFWMREGIQMRVIRMLRTHGRLSKINLNGLFTLLIIKNHRPAAVGIEHQFVRHPRIRLGAVDVGAINAVDVENISNYLCYGFKQRLWNEAF